MMDESQFKRNQMKLEKTEAPESIDATQEYEWEATPKMQKEVPSQNRPPTIEAEQEEREEVLDWGESPSPPARLSKRVSLIS
jgi:hypothetical protein